MSDTRTSYLILFRIQMEEHKWHVLLNIWSSCDYPSFCHRICLQKASSDLRKSSWSTVSYFAPSSLISPGIGPILVLIFGSWNVAIESLNFSGFTVALCSILLYSPLVIICVHKRIDKWGHKFHISKDITFTVPLKMSYFICFVVSLKMS